MGLHVKHVRQTPAVPLFGIYDSSLQVSPQAFQTDPVVRSNNMFPVHKSLTELIAWSHLLLHVSMYHINNLELKAAFLALQCFLSKLQNKQVRLLTDNTTAVACVNHMGTNHFLSCNQSHRHSGPRIQQHLDQSCPHTRQRECSGRL